jgi:beta-galactosidase
LDFVRVRRPEVTLRLDSTTPVRTGQFTPGAETQEIHFANLASGRYFCLEGISSQDGKPYAAVAELDLLDGAGKALSHEGWNIAYVDSEEREREDGSAENAIDGQTVNFWHTEWGAAQPNYPHRLMLDLGQTQKLSGFRYVPRQGGEGVGGRIKDYRIYVGDNLVGQ